MTTAIAPFSGISGLISPPRSNAKSQSAECLLEMEEQIREHLLDSYAIGSPAVQALEELDSIEQEATYAGWDGYCAAKLDPEASKFARVFLTALPTNAPFPEVGADNDGEVTFDWNFGSRRAMTVSIGRSGRCSYAWIRGESSGRGTDWIADEIPASIVHALGQLSS